MVAWMATAVDSKREHGMVAKEHIEERIWCDKTKNLHIDIYHWRFPVGRNNDIEGKCGFCSSSSAW